jgi:hypothetical protein
VTKTELGKEFPKSAPLDGAISFLWRNGYLQRGWRYRDDEFEYSIKNMKGVKVRPMPTGTAKGYHERWDRGL